MYWFVIWNESFSLFLIKEENTRFRNKTVHRLKRWLSPSGRISVALFAYSWLYNGVKESLDTCWLIQIHKAAKSHAPYLILCFTKNLPCASCWRTWGNKYYCSSSANKWYSSWIDMFIQKHHPFCIFLQKE